MKRLLAGFTSLLLVGGMLGAWSGVMANPPSGGTLKVKKEIVDNNSASPSDFSFQVDGGSAIAFEADGENDIHFLSNGLHNVTEVAASDYVTTYDNCNNVNVHNGGTETCTVTNTYNKGTLEVIKKIVGNNSASPSDFSFQIDGNAAILFDVSGTNNIGLNVGKHTVVEVSDPNYTTTYAGGSGHSHDCIDLQVDASNNPQHPKTCTITNTYIIPPPPPTGTLTVNKIVVGGTATTSDFNLFVDGSAVISGTPTTTSVGLHTVTESGGPGGYGTGVFTGDCVTGGKVTVSTSTPANCTLTNTFIIVPPTTFPFTLDKTGDGNGTVDISVDGASSTEACGLDQCNTSKGEQTAFTGNYASGTVLTLTAAPDGDSNFSDSWLGACTGNNPNCTVTITGTTTLTAHFSPNPPPSTGGSGSTSGGSSGGGGGGGSGGSGFPVVSPSLGGTSSGSGGLPSVGSGLQMLCTIPAIPGGFRVGNAVKGDHQLELYWNPASTLATLINIHYGFAGQTLNQTVTSTNDGYQAIGNLLNNHNYDFQLQAVNDCGNSPWTAKIDPRP